MAQLRAELGKASVQSCLDQAAARVREALDEQIEAEITGPVDAAPKVGLIASMNKEVGEEAMNRKVTEDIRTKILAEPAEMGSIAVGKKYGVSNVTVSKLRRDAGIKSHAKPGPGGLRKTTGIVRSVDIDPQRPGAAAALLSALAKQDAARAVVRIELTQAEAAALIGKLSPEQQSAFLAAGLKAALLG